MDDDWFRKTTWTKKDEEEFFGKYKRARTQKGEYLRIQTCILLRTNVDALLEPALMLVNKFFTDFADKEDDLKRYRSDFHGYLGEIYCRFGQYDKSLEYFETSVDEEMLSHCKHEADIDFARIAIIAKRADKYDKAEKLLLMKLQGGVLALQIYPRLLLLAILAKLRGAEDEAAAYKDNAEIVMRDMPMKALSWFEDLEEIYAQL